MPTRPQAGTDQGPARVHSAPDLMNRHRYIADCFQVDSLPCVSRTNDLQRVGLDYFRPPSRTLNAKVA